ncbi:SHOCT domain-containing protein [Tenacibaculum soleae]|uniref:TPR end-of-group domain-containing protein n=1 Tax=Tenacibaculum soleae TaxID=447689 RepID=UPI0026E16497|nr:SHOCT domain-containing protein [Tenacibaculum soleae]MDO6745508.1 SHOCT domain-containing protein [Tenacibaculum soleae]
MIVVIWIILSFMVASMGSSRKIGGTGAFLISIIFSPLIGLLFVIASSKEKKVNKKVVNLTNKALKKQINKEYKESLNILNQALSIDPNEKQTHYNLASIYSVIEKKEKAFFHLEKAVKLGYKNLSRISSSEDFSWLRKQAEFNSFMQNGYKKDNTNIFKDNHLDNLKKLAELKENGVLTDTEFEQEKQKILNSKE